MTPPTDPSPEFERLVDEFLTRVRDGAAPEPEEYAACYPHLAAEIRQVFPTLRLLEEFGSVADARKAGVDLTAPRELGEYLVLREVGRGGMGVVYEAVQQSLGRHVALKVLSPGLHRGEAQFERFRREAQAAARLHHTNIVPVFAVGQENGTHYYAMQFIRGQSLAAVLHELRGTSSPSPTTTALIAASPATPSSRAEFFRNVAHLGAAVADALHHAHQAGVVHRDVKPGNLLLDQRGTVWVTDFGLAKAVGTDDLTNTGDVLGTLAYMAPEQLAGHADARTDVYALGATLYELLTLQPPFRDEVRVRLVDRVRHETPSSPRTLEPLIPRDLETVVLKAIAKEPDRRYTTAAEFAEDLRRFLAGRAVQARRASWVGQSWRWCKRNPAVAGLLATIVTLVTAVTAGSVIATARYQEQRDRARDAEGDAERRAWQAQLSEARAITQSGHPGQRFRALRLIREALATARQTGLRPEDELAFRSVAAGALTRTDFDPTPDVPPQVQAVVNRNGVVTVRRSDGTRIGTYRPRTAAAGTATVSPDGTRVAVAYPKPLGEFVLLAVTNDDVAELDRSTLSLVGKPAFSSDSRRVACLTPEASIWIRDLQERRDGFSTVGSGPSDAVPFAFNPVDGGLIHPYFDRGRYTIRHWRDGVATDLRGPSGAGLVRAIEWDPSGRWYAVADSSRTVRVWDPRLGWAIGSGLDHPEAVVQLRFVGPSDRLMTMDVSRRLRVWDVPVGQLLVNVPNPTGPDLPRITSGGGDADGTELVRTLRLQATEMLTVGPLGAPFSPKEGLVAVGVLLPEHIEQSVGFALLDPATGLPLDVMLGYTVHPLRFLPDGSLLTSGYEGILHWPRTETGDGITFGPPTCPFPRRHFDQDGVTGDNVTALFPQGDTLRLLRANASPIPFETGFGRLEELAASADGRWFGVTKRTHQTGTNLHVYDAAAGRLARSFETRGLSTVGFSPDSRWLWAGGTEVKLWRTGTWEPGPAIGGRRVAIAQDGALAAHDVAGGIRFVRLDGAEAGSEVVTLPTAEHEPLVPMSFSPDGGRFTAYAPESRQLVIWDLRRLRAGLAELGLDWSPHASADQPPPRPLRVRIDPGRYRAMNEAFIALTWDDFATALARLRQALRDDPDNARAKFLLAQVLVLGPPSVRDLEAADRLTAELLTYSERLPENPGIREVGRYACLTLRALVEYHRRRYPQALDLLDRVDAGDARNSPGYQVVRGLVLQAQGTPEAVAVLKRAEEMISWQKLGTTWYLKCLRELMDSPPHTREP